jgi:hypothetical protein
MALTDCPKCWMAEEHCTCHVHYGTPLQYQSSHQMYKDEYEKLYAICLRIHYARIAMRSDLVLKGLEDIDTYFRTPNMN